MSGDKALPILSLKALNRASLARQMLLSRVRLPSLEAIERLAGLQAQAPNPPYYALWSRLEGFRQEELSRLIQDKKAVRIALMRATLHLVSSRDCFSLRSWVQPALDRSLNGAFGTLLGEVDRQALALEARAEIQEEPLTLRELGKRLGKRWTRSDPEALAAAARNLVPLVQVPPRGLWGVSGQAVHTTAEAWLGPLFSSSMGEEEIILRYLYAFGPASVKDIQAWSGLTRLNETVGKLRAKLISFRDERDVELFDLPDAPRPDPETHAPPRFLGEFDNLLLSYADRSRLIGEEDRARVFTRNGIVRSTILVDGFVSGTWKITRDKSTAVLSIEPFQSLSGEARSELTLEGERLLGFAAADASKLDIVFESHSEE
ncbi:winged helix DNA-binding domain-containing protein [Cohnella candidum]|uniref:Winged helix DNA-binding domain-containing protein n=1 Tax=Cohnella candidum TaxID=2674991 RepID=A0A3G3K0A8_9BACL|nr:winged helix DNA-binding domain-containing protein [Cohnella candidum]AYQ73944.1 winged helix DNA-binding domain-containing protein [Cohnella candidum]